jgi:hypothetical protein
MTLVSEQMTTAQHAASLSPGQLYCRSHTHGPWRPWTVDDSGAPVLEVVEECHSCKSRSRYAIDARGDYLSRRSMVFYSPGYLRPKGSGYPSGSDKAGYRRAYALTLVGRAPRSRPKVRGR